MKVQNILQPHGRTATFITLALRPGERDKAKDSLARFCDHLPAIISSFNLRHPANGFSLVVGLGAMAWKTLFPATPLPKELVPFETIKGAKVDAVSTPGDLFFHLKGDRQDVCYEAGAFVQEFFGQVTDPVDETQGFRFQDGRAIIGFVDGTENPDAEESFAVAYVGDEDPEYAGGSYVFAQKYVHDMRAWNALPVEEQEKSIGRRKTDDLELEDEQKRPNAHTTVAKAHDRDGNEIKILRANTPYAQPSMNIFGTYFVGYSRSFTTTRQMLTHMFKGDPAGNYDRLLDFSTPVTGNLFFVPSFAILDKIAAGELN